jgi:hypothetical protein
MFSIVFLLKRLIFKGDESLRCRHSRAYIKQKGGARVFHVRRLAHSQAL